MLSGQYFGRYREPIGKSGEEKKGAGEITGYLTRRSRHGTAGGDGISTIGNDQVLEEMIRPIACQQSLSRCSKVKDRGIRRWKSWFQGRGRDVF
jgi:hypothetical protein